MFLKNGLQVADLLTSGVLPRFPDLQVRVGRERHRLDPVRARGRRPQLPRGARRAARREWELLPSEYFARQVYACTWFETVATTQLLGPHPRRQRILFETDFPHPTCLYGNVRERIEAAFAGVDDDAPQGAVGERGPPLSASTIRRRTGLDQGHGVIHSNIAHGDEGRGRAAGRGAARRSPSPALAKRSCGSVGRA